MSQPEETPIKTYSVKELAILYNPEVSPSTATRRLKRWIHGSQELMQRLQQYGWSEKSKIYTPKQTAILFEWLGYP